MEVAMLDMFKCYEARLHTLPDAPTLGRATSEQLHEHRERLNVIQAENIQPRFGIDSDDEYGWYESACHGMLEQEDFWRQCRLVWSWIDDKPGWLSPVDWDFQILPNPQRAMNRRFRFTLLGGGQITVNERFKSWTPAPAPAPELEFYCHRRDLRVTADAGDGLRRFRGVIDNSVTYEMNAKAVLFLPGTPQSIADRVASTFRLLAWPDLNTNIRGPDPNNFSALLDRSEQCCVCNRALRDHVSTQLGIGPDCAKQLRLPHGLAAANKLLQRRRELLATEIKSSTPGGLHD
jgi:hypothetical protein